MKAVARLLARAIIVGAAWLSLTHSASADVDGQCTIYCTGYCVERCAYWGGYPCAEAVGAGSYPNNCSCVWGCSS